VHVWERLAGELDLAQAGFDIENGSATDDAEIWRINSATKTHRERLVVRMGREAVGLATQGEV